MFLTSNTSIALALTALALVVAGCAGPRYHGQGYGGMGHRQMMAGPTAVSTLQPTAGNTTQGRAMFHHQGDQLWVHVRVQGLKPNAEHGFHIHEKGDCSAADGMSAGGHFNPTGQPHGPQGGPRHAGDLPNLRSDVNGRADVRFSVTGLGIGSGAADIVGRGLIVHADPDDYKTQPTGNSGARLACGVIEAYRR
jgi:superoxide dismutase, Cu-Zn family